LGKCLPVAPPVTPEAPIVTAGFSALNVNWKPITGATSYTLYRKANFSSVDPTNTTFQKADSGIVSPGSPLGNVTSYIDSTDPSANPNFNFYYKVTAVNSGGESSLSPVNTGDNKIKPAIPTNPTVTVGDRKLTINWNSVFGEVI